jgi:hypothetical protein
MAYIGNQIRQYSDRVVLDSLTASATADYTLQLNSVNFVPSSAESLTVSLNGIIQAPISSYTVSGSTLSFSSALTASDSIDFVIAERGITLQTPSAGSVNTTQLATDAVTEAKIADDAVESEHLNDNIISGQTELATAPADTDEFLVSDAGTLKRIDYSLIKGGGITVADQHRISASFVSSANGFITSNLEQVDDASFSNIGTAISQSSGVFTFPTTGIYLITALGAFYQNSSNTHQYVGLEIYVTTNNSTYTRRAGSFGAILGTGEEANSYCSYMFDVTDTSTHKVKFYINQQNTTGVHIAGNTDRNLTHMTFIRLGDT